MRKNKLKDHLISLLFLLPAFLLLAVFIIYPVISTVDLSFRSWKGIYGVAKEFVGLSNYIKVLQSSVFWNSLLNSFYFMLGTFLILMPLSFGLALIITSNMKGTGFMKTMYYLPVMLGTTTVALLWKAVLNPNTGVLAGILVSLGKGSSVFDWLNTAPLNVWITVLINEWKFAGYNMLIFAAGITSIPKTTMEAAKIDGCSGWQQLRHITLPLCKNSFKVFSILGITGCLKVFDIIWAMTMGGPNDASSTPGILVYQFAYNYKKYGRSAAIAVILLVLGVMASIICNRVFKQEDIY
ncbi:MAG: carbohydrate ABC transporter permease [Candidatus Avoscillospira sp.]